MDLSLSYFGNGNIASKSDLENGASYGYGENHSQCSTAPGPHALTSIGSVLKYCYDSRGNQVRSYDSGFLVRDITYTSYDKPSRIWSVHGQTDLYYDANKVMYKRVDTKSGNTRTTLNVGSVEVIKENG